MFYYIYYILVDVHSTNNDVSNIDDIEVREHISSDNQETHEEVKHKSIDGICTENIITSPDIQEECKINTLSIILF